jgi:Tol biopolymer transport system component/predicted Ser/Thr protein kinase
MAGPANQHQPGDMLGPYRVDSLIGKGGMGEVYRGTDTRLGRPVALKVSARQFSDRFEREAKAISSLNHANICTLYDVGPNYLVLEFVEGDTLSHAIKQGPMPLEKVLQYSTQIADALSAAHAKGIVHRDLKPANIILTSGGVKVLDFGLAKLSSTAKFGTSGSSEIETRTEPLTSAGAIMGTLHYMAPEQAEGKDADERADIFALGAVMYEMLTGQRAFDGDTSTAILAAVLKDQPAPITQFQPMTPRALDRVVRKCLEKKPSERWHSAHDLKQTLELIDLAGPTSSSTSVSSGIPPVAPASGRRIRKWLWPAVAVAGVIVAGVALWAPWKKAAPTQAVRFEVAPSEKMTFIPQAAMAVSPDGRWMVFPARGEDGVARYYIRALDGVEVRALPGTEAVANWPPASWSFDSRWVVFAWSADRKIKKVDIQGGPPQNLADFPGLMSGASWNSEGVIIARSAAATSILRVPAAGGQASSVTALAPGETRHVWPQFLPDGKHFLYLRVSTDAAKGGVYIGSIDAKPNEQSMQRLLASDRQAYYAAAPGGGAGHLIFMRGAALMAQPFDPNKMTLSGEPAAIADGVDTFTTTNHGLFSVSDTGTLVYRAGTGSQTVLTWFDQQGNPAGTLGDPGDYVNPAISPDGSRVAVAMGPLASRDIWILDVARGTSTRFTFDPARDDNPAWSPDGKNIAFSSNRGGQLDIYIKPADGSGEEKLLLKTDEPKQVERWTKDGRFLLFTSTAPKTLGDMWALPFPGEAKPVPLLQTQFIEGLARVSPDGRWLAYTSTESGAPENYVRPFTPEAPAGTGAKWLVSKGGGIRPLWRPDGKELFYLTPGGLSAMAVDIDAAKGFQAGTPRRMFNAPSGALTTGWDLSPDGKRFLFAAPPGAGGTIPFTVVLNWAAGLKK